MNDDAARQLRAAIAVREAMTPDPADVLAGLEGVVRRRRRRQRMARAAGAVVAAGVTAAFLLSSVGDFGLEEGLRRTLAPAERVAPHPAPTPESAPPSAPPPAPMSPAESQIICRNAGYGDSDVMALAQRWGLRNTLETFEAAARRIQAGEELPIAPGSNPAGSVPSPEDTARDAYEAAGYTLHDAGRLAQIWQVPAGHDHEAVVRAGWMLIDGQQPPIAPGSTPGDLNPPEAPDPAQSSSPATPPPTP